MSKMVLIHPEMDQDANILRIRVPLDEGETTVETPLEPAQEELDKMELIEGIEIWAHIVDGYAVSQEADAVLSRVSPTDILLQARTVLTPIELI